MDKLKIAFCIATYNRSIMVEEFLGQFSNLFLELEIDIYYYDSSDDNKSRVVVEKWMLEYKNIHYVQIPTSWHANKKVLYIIEEFGINQKYDYLWVCGDSLRFSESVIRKVIKLLKINYDMIIVSHSGKEHPETREYIDKNELFQNCAWYMTLFGAVILNVHTMIKDVPWREIKEKYEVPNHINYSHVGYYFEMINKLDKMRTIYLSVDQGVWTSRYKTAGGWFNDAFKVLCEYWPSTIEELPHSYTNKKDAINKLGYCSCLTPRSFLQYRNVKAYNIHIFLKYRKILKDMSRLNYFQLWSLSCLSSKLAYFIAINDIPGYFSNRKKIYKLNGFCKKYKDLYVYGAGRAAEQYGRYLMKKGVNYSGFLVTSKESNPDELLNHPVFLISEHEETWKNKGIILGLNQQNLKEVQPVLIKYGLWENTFHEYILPFVLEER